MDNLKDILKLFSGRNLDKEMAGLSQERFNQVAEKLEKAGYAKAYREEGSRDCRVLALNDLGIKERNRLK